MNNWNKNKLVGNNAEKIVEFLINSIPNWKCNEFGVETHIKDIKDIARNVINPVTSKIRTMPDFVAFNQLTGNTFFIEVKYRSKSESGGYILNNLEDYNKYWEGTKLIIVRQNPPHFVWIDLEKIDPSSMVTIKQIEGKQKSSWDFGWLEKDIKTLFPELTPDIITDAIKAIPRE